ncbi:arsenate reductase ArsC [Dyella sp. A6]|uniref:arsenate reductase ArsC n=1 Tax=Dyella aluminiiresistens TaxID=3069105 RepID=UPI002E787545|nr:arsenate reductase ArsC [Dyella sp. A6]
MHGHYNVLYICTGNSARSIFAEVLTDHLGHGHFKGYSAGSHPLGHIHPRTLEALTAVNLPTTGLRSKGWDEFARPGAPVMDFIITVCDQAAAEQCPAWPGAPITAHWSIPDPAKVVGDDDTIRKAFALARGLLQQRIGLLLNLPIEKLDRLALKSRIEALQAPDA